MPAQLTISLRPILLLTIAAACACAADLETITTIDGRSMTGYYDEDAGTLTLAGSGHAKIKIAASQVASRMSAPAPAAVEALDPIAVQERVVAAAEADRDHARAESARLRAIALHADGDERVTLLLNANHASDEAADCDARALRARARLAEIRDLQKMPKPSPVATASAQGEPGYLAEIARQRQAKSDAESALAQATSALGSAILAARMEFFRSADLSPIPLTIPASPTSADLERAQGITAFNARMATAKRNPEAAAKHESDSFFADYARLKKMAWAASICEWDNYSH